ncbi:bifunctional acetyl-CoA hydrolase/transferase family protein/GNAT family N-acetyltransferase [Pyxidicoccus sp. MSG2]|uniref:bifunctional acetyl-CoA hydrolase/transferase family protein/GNAT family N-acetyltransferase n=1 Tax=Pyxidicoccus sp. MSG2 TaxID=2996790 RepID=UPI00226FB82E|nr:bifunctional acetyl-CoA hydrolase/transferase family protein/GNAT family N-acetyltransferase [Pyxidicoccus sp. MSG2]MCY1022350.1 GNAT family N-acetyltransferase [Pyxidicoccus sp. MSG2]
MHEQQDWRQRYADRVVTAEEAIRGILPGRRILIGSGAAEPVTLVRALVEKGEHLADNEVVHLLTLGPAPYVEPAHARRFRHTAFFIGSNVRQAVQEGRADFMPVFLSEIPELIRNRRVRIDVALLQVSPPDAHGYVSLGVSVDIVRSAVDAATLLIAEVNPNMPRTHGDSFLDVRRIHHLVPVDSPLLEAHPEPADEVSRQIGAHLARMIPDGATLQTGIGKIPDAVLAQLGGHQELGVHTEMLSDGVMRLVEAGVITGRRKTLLPGKLVTSFIMGSRELYAWAHENPAIEMRPSDFTNDPQTVARNDTMIAINGALAVDLTGQVAADTLGGSFYSGIGGQVDFLRGARRSRGGKPILALPSTAKGGTVSRIQAALEPGTGVVTSRGDVHYVVTEYGVADLWGKNIRERALALIDIAHPDFRGELMAAAKGRRWVLPDQVVPRARYPWAEARLEHTLSGDALLIRPARIPDERALQELMYGLSSDSCYRRFLELKKTHPHEEMQQLVDLDYEHSMALVACPPGTDEVVGVVRYDVDPATRLADVAFVVRDDWQGRGVGTVLMRRIREAAAARGIPGFQADVLVTNKPMLDVFQESGLPIRTLREDGVYHLELHFPAGP